MTFRSQELVGSSKHSQWRHILSGATRRDSHKTKRFLKISSQCDVPRRQDDDGSDGEDKEEEEAEDPIAALEVLEAADETDPTYLLYPPLALRTPRQKRTQIVLLGELVLDVQRAFNRHLDRLHSAKEDCVDKARKPNPIQY